MQATGTEPPQTGYSNESAFQHSEENSSIPALFNPHWHRTFRTFFSQLGFSQSLRGFEADMLVLNETWEQQTIPHAIQDLIHNLLHNHTPDSAEPTPDGFKKDSEGSPMTISLEERKLEYVRLANGAPPRTPTSVTRSIAQLLARNRARNDASNRAEFLMPRKAATTSAAGDGASASTPTCARTDARQIDRDVQMKYDIAKNEDGPLRRTVGERTAVPQDEHDGPSAPKRRRIISEELKTEEDDPWMNERLVNVETHLAVRFVPAKPYTLHNRLKYLEDYIIRLEKDYPPWAALHFNQPRRAWPPPPRPMPIIVPPHLTVPPSSHQTTTSSMPPETDPQTSAAEASKPTSAQFKGKGKQVSSLHRAVMEKLEVKRAREEIGER